MTKPGTSLPVRLANFAGAVFLRPDRSLTRTDILACRVIGEAAAGMLHFVIPIWELPHLLFGASRAAFVAAPLGALGVVYGGIYLGRRWLSALPDWETVYADELSILFVRRRTDSSSQNRERASLVSDSMTASVFS